MELSAGRNDTAVPPKLPPPWYPGRGSHPRKGKENTPGRHGRPAKRPGYHRVGAQPSYLQYTGGDASSSCCSALMLMDAAMASHPRYVERQLKHGSGRDELLRRPFARLPQPLHEAVGTKPIRRVNITWQRGTSPRAPCRPLLVPRSDSPGDKGISSVKHPETTLCQEHTSAVWQI